MPREVTIREFPYTPIGGRFLYHSSEYGFNGDAPLPSQRVGTLVYQFSPANRPGTFYPISYVKVWGARAVMEGVPLLSASGVQNLFGNQPPGLQPRIRIRLFIVPSLADRAFNFTEITNLGPNPYI